MLIQNNRSRVNIHKSGQRYIWEEVLDHFELTDGRLLRITTDSASLHCTITWELQSRCEAPGLGSPPVRNDILYMVQVIEIALGGCMNSVAGKGCSKSFEAHLRNQHFGENKCTHIAKHQGEWKEGKARINKVSAQRPGLVKIIQTLTISRHFERPETDLHIAEDACCIDYTDTWSSKWVHWVSKSHSTIYSPTCYGCEHMVEFDSGVAWVNLPIMRIHARVAP